jgi:hypothetical protein
VIPCSETRFLEETGFLEQPVDREFPMEERVYCEHCEQTYRASNLTKCSLCGTEGRLRVIAPADVPLPPEAPAPAGSIAANLPDEARTQITALRSAGAGTEEIKQKLAELGHDPQAVHTLLAEKGIGDNTEVDPARAAYAQALRQAGYRNMAIGGLVCLVGAIATAASFGAAQAGGTYIIFWGAIIFGGVQFFRGLTQASEAEKP